MPWTVTDLPDLSGTTSLVTGANSGLGAATTIALAARGAHVVLATRSEERTRPLLEEIRERRPDASVEHVTLDLADLGQVRTAAERLLDEHAAIDHLVANAGIMAPPRSFTADGFELQIGVNHLGHFALVGHLLPALLAAKEARVVTVSSTLHRLGQIDPETLGEAEEPYDRWAAYGRSKLANLLYVSELHRRSSAAGSPIVSVGAHPGYASTNLQFAGPTQQGGVSGWVTATASRIGNTLLAQPASQGALPQLYAAAEPAVPGGTYWGPDGPAEQRGYPALAAWSPRAQDRDLARAVWDRSEELTGVTYELPVLRSA